MPAHPHAVLIDPVAAARAAGWPPPAVEAVGLVLRPRPAYSRAGLAVVCLTLLVTLAMLAVLAGGRW